MHDIPMTEVTPEFASCWQTAAMYVEHAAGGQLDAWLSTHFSERACNFKPEGTSG